ncbi:hypothetical protein PVAP13_9NG018851 [Panicum virgatum]|uniref:Uncharacterized protein n=1 Tax=Panicum virgatum TaxID=38727 RepID=A0A8T0MB45_PANVG|nr:hypothetical protein PVAP13_9NG018851 [Panicum virgatum]
MGPPPWSLLPARCRRFLGHVQRASFSRLRDDFFSENPPAQSRDELPVVSRGDAPVPCSKAEETMQLPLYGLVSQRRRRAWIPRGQRPMATIEQYWARGSFSRQIHLHPPKSISISRL